MHLLIFLQIFLVSGGDFTVSTEILEDGKWKILWNAKLPLPGTDALYGLRLATVANQVYSFGIFFCYFFIHIMIF